MSNLWSLVLAGGAGRRLATEAYRHYGYARPKQFCDFDGHGTLLEQTMERAMLLTSESRTAVLTTRSHRREALESLQRYPLAQVIEQPSARDTGPGILLALKSLERKDPQATVVMLPSDHFVADDEGFARQVLEAAHLAQRSPHRVVLLAAEHEEAHAQPEGYGWVIPAEPRKKVSAVERFREKPAAAEGAALRAQGAAVNTFVMAGTVAAFTRLCEWWMPEWSQALSQDDLRASVERAYDILPAVNFSREVLEEAVRFLEMYRLEPVGWSDIGTPARLQEALGELVTQPTSRLRARPAPTPAYGMHPRVYR